MAQKTPKDSRDDAARAGVERTAYGQPRQLFTRLMELTPELIAHYADAPVQQPVDTEDETEETGQ